MPKRSSWYRMRARDWLKIESGRLPSTTEFTRVQPYVLGNRAARALEVIRDAADVDAPGVVQARVAGRIRAGAAGRVERSAARVVLSGSLALKKPVCVGIS